MGRSGYEGGQIFSNDPEAACIGPQVNRRLTETIGELSRISLNAYKDPEFDWIKAGSTMIRQEHISKLKESFDAASTIKDPDEQTWVKVMTVIERCKWALMTEKESESIARALSVLSGLSTRYEVEVSMAQRRLRNGTLHLTSPVAKQVRQGTSTSSDQSLNESLPLLASDL